MSTIEGAVFEPHWLQRVAERTVEKEKQHEGICLKTLVRNCLDALIHFFMYRFSERYHNFYNQLRREVVEPPIQEEVSEEPVHEEPLRISERITEWAESKDSPWIPSCIDAAQQFEKMHFEEPFLSIVHSDLEFQLNGGHERILSELGEPLPLGFGSSGSLEEDKRKLILRALDILRMRQGDLSNDFMPPVRGHFFQFLRKDVGLNQEAKDLAYNLVFPMGNRKTFWEGCRVEKEGKRAFDGRELWVRIWLFSIMYPRTETLDLRCLVVNAMERCSNLNPQCPFALCTTLIAEVLSEHLPGLFSNELAVIVDCNSWINDFFNDIESNGSRREALYSESKGVVDLLLSEGKAWCQKMLIEQESEFLAALQQYIERERDTILGAP